MTRGLWFLATLSLALLLPPSGAYAFVRTTTCAATCTETCASNRNGVCDDGGDDADNDSCALGSDCTDCGYRPGPSANSLYACRDGEVPIPVFWEDLCVPVYINSAPSDDLGGPDDLRGDVEAALDTWNSVGCSGLSVVLAGTTDVSVPGYDHTRGDANVNFIGFVEDGWAERGYPSLALALTSVTFDIRTGRIYDADIEFNGDGYTFRNDDSDATLPTAHDFLNTLTHELGHFYGLEHSVESRHIGSGAYHQATMFESSPAGETAKRALHEDDRAGVCETYPQPSVACTFDEEHLEASPDGKTTTPRSNDKRGCACASAATGPPPGAALIALLAMFARRRR